MELEKRGVPTVTFVANVFTRLAKAEVTAMGIPDLPLAVVPFPMASVTEEEARARAEKVLDQVVTGLTVAAEQSQLAKEAN